MILEAQPVTASDPSVLGLLLAFFKKYISISADEFVVRLEIRVLLNLDGDVAEFVPRVGEIGFPSDHFPPVVYSPAHIKRLKLVIHCILNKVEPHVFREVALAVFLVVHRRVAFPETFSLLNEM